uniref:RNA polymerase II-associated factor 1 homolog n=1 Tax=Arcella intermedia TaxID=1963864 RepID=A0A6B2L8M5_9EUKA
MPDLPYEPKFLNCSKDLLKFVKYQSQNLEREVKVDLLCGQDVGIALDLIDLTPFIAPDHPPPLDPIDQQLVEGATKPLTKKDTHFAFLLHPQYVAAPEPETRAPVASSFIREHKEDLSQIEVSKEKQIELILQSFEATEEPPKHPTNPKLRPVEILPLLPDEETWGNEYSEMIFDSNPVEELDNNDIRKKRKNAVIKAVSTPNQDTAYLRYFTPKRRRLNDEDEEEEIEEELEGEVDYELNREYTYRLHKGEGENFVFFWKDNEVTYNEIKNKVVMQKATKDSEAPVPFRVVLKHLPALTPAAQQQLEAAKEILLDHEGKLSSSVGLRK